jgi:formylmethanofuran dehydrogenase subunit C
VSGAITLALRAPLEGALDLGGVVPDRLNALGAAEIAALEVRYRGRPTPLGELFTVDGERAPSVRLRGDLARAERIGAGMQGGELVVEGPAGADAGRGMVGGRLEIPGDAGDGAGVAMAGGTLVIGGSAGARLGAAAAGEKRGMTGGEIVVGGSVGPEAGASIRRGLIVVVGDAGPRAMLGALAGTLVVFGRTGAEAGVWSRRGSIVALGPVEPTATYRFDCVYRPTWLALLLRRIARQLGAPVEARHLDGLWRRYSGDLAEVGRGEILAWTAA